MSHKKSSFGRRAPTKNPRDRVLIVCEGEKTEPFYFSDLVRALGLSGTDVRICGKECGSDPQSIVKYAFDAAKADGAFDHVFCVFDRDTHANVNAAIGTAKGLKVRGAVFTTTLSVPCFEYWLIVHHGYFDRPFAKTRQLSVGGACLSELQRIWPDYKKKLRGVYSAVADKTDRAIANAKRREIDAANGGSDNPSTEVYKIVERLRKIASDG